MMFQIFLLFSVISNGMNHLVDSAKNHTKKLIIRLLVIFYHLMNRFTLISTKTIQNRFLNNEAPVLNSFSDWIRYFQLIAANDHTKQVDQYFLYLFAFCYISPLPLDPNQNHPKQIANQWCFNIHFCHVEWVISCWFEPMTIHSVLSPSWPHIFENEQSAQRSYDRTWVLIRCLPLHTSSHVLIEQM